MGAHWFQISVTCIKEKIVCGEEKNWEGGRGGKIVILPKSTSPQIPNNKTSKKKKHINKQHSRQVIRQGKLRKITKCLLTRFS